MNTHDADRDLLFGILAFQNNFIDRAALLAAFDRWTQDKATPLDQHLVELDHMTERIRDLLAALVDEHVAHHGGNAEESLASVSGVSSSLFESLSRIHDADIDRSLASVPCSSPEPDVTVAYRTVTRDVSLGETSLPGGRFTILRPHAEGGLGRISVALDQELHREVAFKDIRDEHAGDSNSRARFILEAEITGSLEHPGIVPVYGLGSHADGRPFYAMRFVRGDNLKQAIERYHSQKHETQLELRKLLGRFLDVCNAVDYAHSRGVLHRDLKPGNIMLGNHGETLLVDWGLAKVGTRPDSDASSSKLPIAPSSGSAVEPTQFGSAIGTPAYMSPEQAEGRLDQHGPASDVYGLGATLYELLTGQRPFAKEEGAAVLERVRRGEFAPLRQVNPSVPKALEAVCLQAMNKRPEDRYPSARALADDVEHYLADEPLSAFREPAAARAARWFRKHPAVASTAAAVLVLSAIGAGLAAAQQNAHARALAAQTKKAEAREEMAIDAVKRFRDAVAENPELKGNPKLESLRKTLLKEPLAFFQRLRDELQADNDTRPVALARLASAAFELGYLTDEIGDKQDALNAYEESRGIRERLAGENPTVTQFRHDLAASHNKIGGLLSETGKPDEALAAYEQGLGVWERLARENPTVIVLQNDLAGSHHNIGLLLSETGKPDEALAAYEQAREIRERLARENPTVTEFQNDLAGSHNNIGVLLRHTGKLDEALAAVEQAREIWERLARENPTVTQFQLDLATSHNNIGNLLRQTGKPAEALASHEQAREIRERLARENPTVTEFQNGLAKSHNNIGVLLRETGKTDEALAAYEQAREIRERLVRENPTVTEFQNLLAGSHNNIGGLLRRTGKPDEALAAFEQALEIRERLAPAHPESPDYASSLGGTLGNIVLIDLDAKRFVEARDRLRQAIEWQKKALAANPNHPTYRQFLAFHYLSLLKAAQGLNDSALAAEAQQGLDELSGRGGSGLAAQEERLAAVLGGEPAKDPAELLALSQRAYNTFRFASAAWLWGEALSSDPKLVDDRRTQHAYNAACAAALAGAGRGKDDPVPDDDAKAKFRGQALTWLQAELDAWSKLVDSATPAQREAIVTTLVHWHNDSDLSWVRGEKIDTLPETERDAWRALWEKVDEVRKAVDTPCEQRP